MAYLNIQEENNDTPSGIDFAKNIEEWQKFEPVNEVNSVIVPVSRHNENKVKCAKQLELENWKQFGVNDEIPYSGQKLMSTRWVITEKETEGVGNVKARLVVRGFEEECDVKSDSPTVHKESLRLFLAAAATQNYDIHSLDIKAAFLQGQNIDRIIYVQPPKECASNKAVVWKLNKCVYVLVDVSMKRFLSVKKECVQLKCEQSKLGPALFYWHREGKLEGIFLIHVDDFLWAGSVNFQKDVIAPLRLKFHFGKEMNNKFRYIGHDIEQDYGQIYLQQHGFTEELNQVDKTVQSRDVMNDIYPEIVGQLHWIATQSRPDLCFDVLDLSTLCDLSESKLRSEINKVVRKAKYNQYKIVFPCLET